MLTIASIYLTPCFFHFLFVFLVLFLYIIGLYLLLVIFDDFLFQCVLLWFYGVLGTGVFAFGGEIVFQIGFRWVLLSAFCVCVVLARLGGLGFAGIPVCVLGGGRG